MPNQILFFDPTEGNIDISAKNWAEEMTTRPISLHSGYKIFTKGDIPQEVITKINDMLSEKYADSDISDDHVDDDPEANAADKIIEYFVEDFQSKMQSFGWSFKQVSISHGFHYLFEMQ